MFENSGKLNSTEYNYTDHKIALEDLSMTMTSYLGKYLAL